MSAVSEVSVLLVDDETADATAAALEREDDRLTVETAGSASEGLDRLAETRVDCVVSAYDIPDRNGVEFLRAVRDEHGQLPFILCPESESWEIASDAISAGVTDYLPWRKATGQPGALAERIGDAVEHSSQSTVNETEETLSMIAGKTDDVLFIFDDDWSDLLFVNSAYEDIWGVPIAELEADPSSFLEYVHPEDLETVTQSLERLSEGEPDELEYRVVRPDGERRWVRAEGKPMLDDDGTVTRIVGFVRDITERKARESELERYEAIVENTEDGIYVFDENSRFEFVNQRVADVSGIPRDAWIGEHVSIHTDLGTLTEAEVEAIEDAIEAVAGGETEEARVEVNPDVPGELRDLELRMTPLRADEGDSRVIAFSRDITEQRERERELERQNERVDEFASVVSHDLRNPLNVADLRLELARDECNSEHLDDVARALDRMETLIEDLLTLARVEREIDDEEVVDLAALAEQCWGTVDTAEATLALETGSTILADRTRLQQLLENLVRNAVEHSSTSPDSQAPEDAGRERSSEPSVADAPEDGASNVTVTVGDLDDGFFIADDGPGIPPEEREAVFESGHSTKEDGTGFGLSIVAEIVETHGWEVSVTESEAGGARFEITGVEFVE
jgi:PAS domain S-box-containing protein